MVTVADLTVPASDGLPLRATLFSPDAPTHAAIVGGATAVPRGFYRAFATYLAERGVAVLTYDHRGEGEPPAQLRSSKARMRDWGTLDFAGAIEWTSQRYAGLPLVVVGHSHGGHALLLAPNNTKIARAMTVATQTGYWRYCAPGERYRVWLLLNVLAPIAVRLQGYVPGRKLGLGEDLAPGVMREWRAWCMLPDYFFDDPTMREALQAGSGYDAPTLVVGLSDDTWGTPEAVDAFAKHFPAMQRRTIVPADYGLHGVGHFGFFRSKNGAALWPLVADYFGLQREVAV